MSSKATVAATVDVRGRVIRIAAWSLPAYVWHRFGII